MSDNVKSSMISAMFIVAAAAALLFLWWPEMAAVWFWSELCILLAIFLVAAGYSYRQKQIKYEGQVAPT